VGLRDFSENDCTCRGRAAVATTIALAVNAIMDGLGAVVGGRSPPPSHRARSLVRRGGRRHLDIDLPRTPLLPGDKEHPHRHGSRGNNVRATHNSSHPSNPRRMVICRREEQKRRIDHHECARQGGHSILVDGASCRKYGVGGSTGAACPPCGPCRLLRCQRNDARDRHGAKNDDGGKAQERGATPPLSRQQ